MAKPVLTGPRVVAATAVTLGLILGGFLVLGPGAGPSALEVGLVAGAAGLAAATALRLGARAAHDPEDTEAQDRRVALRRMSWAALAWGGAAGLGGFGRLDSAMALVISDLLAVTALVLFARGFFRLTPPPVGLRSLLRLYISAYIAAVSLFGVAWTLVVSGAATDSAAATVPAALALVRLFAGLFILALLAPLVLTSGFRVRCATVLAMVVLVALCVADLCGALTRLAAEPFLGGVEHVLRAPALLLLATLPWLVRRPEISRPRRITGRGLHRVGPDLFAAVAVAVAVLVWGIYALGWDARPFSTVLVVLIASAALALLLRGLGLLEENAELAKSLAGRERHQHALARHHGDVVAVLDARGRIVEVSAGTAEAYGYSAEDLQAADVAELVHPEDLPRLREVVPARRRGPDASVRLRVRLRAADGTWRHIDATASPFEGRGARGGLLVTARDISAHVALHDQVAHLTFHDAATGLPNRAYVEQRAKELLAAAEGQIPAAVLSVHLDAIDVAAGRRLGDALLAQIARRLRTALAADDTVARSGEEEFVVLVKDPTDAGSVARAAEGLLEALDEEPFSVGGHQVAVTASVGAALADAGHLDGAELLRQAELAATRARDRGAGGHVDFAGSPTAAADEEDPPEAPSVADPRGEHHRLKQ